MNYVLLINLNYMKDENKLLEEARRWFALSCGETAESAGYHCIKLWYKPIPDLSFRIHQLPEVVFGPGEKEINTFIKVQSIIRWGLIVFSLLIPLGILTIFGVVVTHKFEVLIFASYVCLALCITCVIMGVYLSTLEKTYHDKIITYMKKMS